MKKVLKILILFVSIMSVLLGNIEVKGFNENQMSHKFEVCNSIDAKLIKLVKAFLPEGAKFERPINPEGTKAIRLKDLDGDGIDEIAAIYNIKNDRKKKYLTVLKKYDDEWNIILETNIKGYYIDRLSFADIDGDGISEVFFAGKVSDFYKTLDVYKWNGKKLKRIVNVDYSKLEIEDMLNQEEGDNKVELAVWIKDSGEAYIIDVFRWNGSELIIAKDVYPHYFKRVAYYYETKVKQSPNNALYWYYLADAQIKIGNNEEALRAIENGLSINTEYPSKEQFNKLSKMIKED